MTIMSGGDYDKPLEEFNEVFTDPDELLGVLESCLEPFVAKKALCEIFQVYTERHGVERQACDMFSNRHRFLCALVPCFLNLVLGFCKVAALVMSTI